MESIGEKIKELMKQNNISTEELPLVGDGLEKDIKCAERAGIDSCWINRNRYN